jgi:hypothetical protein
VGSCSGGPRRSAIRPRRGGPPSLWRPRSPSCCRSSPRRSPCRVRPPRHRASTCSTPMSTTTTPRWRGTRQR